MSRDAVLSPPSIVLLPPSALTLIWQCLDEQTAEAVRYQHEATLSAAQTQAVLPPGVLVQKTVTLAFADPHRSCVLWTGVGDFQISKEAIRVVAEQLGFSRRATRSAIINPGWLDPVAAFGMEPGMVSPFLPPPLPGQQTSPIAALVVESWPTTWERTMRVAISLSLYESLIVPLNMLRSLLHYYSHLAYPSVPCLFLPADLPSPSKMCSDRKLAVF